MLRKAGTSGSGRGRRKRNSYYRVTSPATYFTARRDLWEPGGAIPPGHPTVDLGVVF
jgi:hypothetical protein